MRLVIAQLVKRADYITAVSKFILKELEIYNFDTIAKSSCIFMLGYCHIQHSENLVHENYNPFLLSVGRFSKEKGFDLLVEAFRDLTIFDKTTSLIIIGDGPEKVSISQMISKYNLHDRIILKGTLSSEQIEPYYRNCLFFIAPSRMEGLGVAVLEALSHGKTVVATKVGGLPEIVIDDVTGILVQSVNIKELTLALKRLINDNNLRTTYERNAKAFMKTIGDWNNVAQSYSEVYHIVLNNRDMYPKNEKSAF